MDLYNTFIKVLRELLYFELSESVKNRGKNLVIFRTLICLNGQNYPK